jgi:hypothetical protein
MMKMMMKVMKMMMKMMKMMRTRMKTMKTMMKTMKMMKTKARTTTTNLDDELKSLFCLALHTKRRTKKNVLEISFGVRRDQRARRRAPHDGGIELNREPVADEFNQFI